jgi:hypothetical protein
LPTVSKKARPSLTQEAPEQEDEEEDDLFDLDAPSSSQTPLTRSPARADLVAHLGSLVALSAVERKSVAIRTGELRRIVQLTQQGEVDELRNVLRVWRVLGKKVTPQAGEEIVGQLESPAVSAQVT